MTTGAGYRSASSCWRSLPVPPPGPSLQPKRVLIVHSFGSTAPPFTTHSTAFETTLTKEMGDRVDIDEVSLDIARYAQPDMEGPFVEFLLARLAKWQPDLVVPIGSPAGRFVAKYRDRLFPGTPIIYTGMDRRTLPPDAITENATLVGESSTWPAWSRTSSSSRRTRTTSRLSSAPRCSSDTGRRVSPGVRAIHEPRELHLPQ